MTRDTLQDLTRVMLFIPDPNTGNIRVWFKRVRHFLFCFLFISAMAFVLVVGGWIASLFFWTLVMFAFELMGSLADDPGRISMAVWLPVAVCLASVWIVIVAIPTIWMVLNLVAVALGALSAVFPALSRSASFVRVVRWLFHAAFRVVSPVRRLR